MTHIKYGKLYILIPISLLVMVSVEGMRNLHLGLKSPFSLGEKRLIRAMLNFIPLQQDKESGKKKWKHQGQVVKPKSVEKKIPPDLKLYEKYSWQFAEDIIQKAYHIRRKGTGEYREKRANFCNYINKLTVKGIVEQDKDSTYTDRRNRKGRHKNRYRIIPTWSVFVALLLDSINDDQEFGGREQSSYVFDSDYHTLLKLEYGEENTSKAMEKIDEMFTLINEEREAKRTIEHLFGIPQNVRKLKIKSGGKK